MPARLRATAATCHPLSVRDVPYTEVAPPPDLAAYVDRFWYRARARDGAHAHRVLPDGCVDVLIDVDHGTAHVVGTMRRALVVPARAGALIAARFRPGVAAAVLGRPLAELTDLRIAVADVGLAALFDPVVEIATRNHSPGEAIAAFARVLRGRLRARPDRLVLAAIDVLKREPRAIEALASDLGVTRQHLTRRFKIEVGIGPKELARIARMQRVVAAIERGRHDFARLALEQGYADQSHLSHEVSALVGLSPSALAASPTIEAAPRPLPHLFG